MDDTRLLAVHQTSAAPTVDVVLIHGLGGDEQSTWQSASDSDASSWWPNWLAEERPGVRIWSAGYPTTMTSWFAQTLPIPALAGNLAHRLRNQGVGDRPIVWVGHSMGGLVIKQILTDAALRSNPELKRLWLNTFAIQFLATPHSGSDVAGLAVFLTRCAQWSLAGAGLASSRRVGYRGAVAGYSSAARSPSFASGQHG